MIQLPKLLEREAIVRWGFVATSNGRTYNRGETIPAGVQILSIEPCNDPNEGPHEKQVGETEAEFWPDEAPAEMREAKTKVKSQRIRSSEV